MEPDAAEEAANAILHRVRSHGALDAIASLDPPLREPTLRILVEFDLDILVAMVLEAMPARAAEPPLEHVVVPLPARRHGQRA